MSTLARIGRGLPGDAPQRGHALRQEGLPARRLRRLLPAPGHHLVTTEAARGHPAQRGEPDLVGDAAGWSAASRRTCGPSRPTPRSPRRVCCPAGASRTTPYLFSPTEITALIAAARALAHPLRAASFETLIGLMAVTGLRTGRRCRWTARTWTSPSMPRSGGPSSASPARCRCTRPPRRRSRPTRRAATSCARAPRRPASSSPARHPAQPHQHLHHVRRPARGRRDRDRPVGADRGSTTCATASPSPP